MGRMKNEERPSIKAFAITKKELVIGEIKFLKVMREFKAGKLTVGNKKVTKRIQAVAIAFSEARSAIKKQRRK